MNKFIVYLLFNCLSTINSFNIVAYSTSKNIDNAYKKLINNNLNLFVVDNEDYLNKMIKITDFLLIDNDCFINKKTSKKLDDYGVPYIDYTKLGYIHNLRLFNNEPYDFYIDTINDKKIKMYCDNSNLKLITTKETLNEYDQIKIEKSINTLDTLYNKVNIELPKMSKSNNMNTSDFIYYLIFKKINEKFYLDTKYF